MNNKTTVVFHSADFDGIFCREIAKKFLPDAELIGWDFGDAPLDAALLVGPIVILDLPVDRPFGLQFKDGWICRGNVQVQPIDRWETRNIIWIDHHKSSIDSHPNEIPGYRIDGVAACRLAWQWFSYEERGLDGHRNQLDPNLPTKQEYIDRTVLEPISVRLAGEYDIWDKRDARAETFQFGLRSRELSEEDWKWILTVRDNMKQGEYDLAKMGAIVTDLLQDGELLQRYQQETDASIVQYRSFMLNWEGLKFLALNTARCNSLTFASKDNPETGHDALMGFYFDGKQWKISLYHAKHRTVLDLSQIAAKHGGGGHRGACGFTCANIPFGTDHVIK